MKITSSLLPFFLSSLAPLVASVPISEYLNCTSDNSVAALGGVVDLTKPYPMLDTTTTEISIPNRNTITVGFLKEKFNQDPKLRLFVQDSGTYLVHNYLKDKASPFEIQEWDYNDASVEGVSMASTQLTPELLQNTRKGSGSVGSTMSLEVSTSIKFNAANSFDISPKIELTWITMIPGSFIGFTFSGNRKKTRSYKYSTSLSVSATCNAIEGNSVVQFLDVGFDKVKDIKVRSLSFVDGQWQVSDWEYYSSYSDPKPRVRCVSG